MNQEKQESQESHENQDVIVLTIEDQIRLAVREAITPLVQEIKDLKARVNGDINETLNAKEAAKFLGVGLNLIRELSRDPSFYPAIRIGERRVVFSKNLLIKWRDESNGQTA